MRKKKENYWKILLVFCLSFFFGLNFPDIDLSLMFILSHRSILTHGIILPLIFYIYLVKKSKIDKTLIDIFYAGILLGITIHLLADLVPKAYIGYALIKLPFNISIGKELSILWMSSNVLAALIITTDLISKIEVNKLMKIFIYILPLIVGGAYMLNENDPYFKLSILFVASAFTGYRVYKK